VATQIPDSSSIPSIGLRGKNHEVSLWIRETVGGKRRFVKPNKKKIYPEGTVFCLRHTADGKRRRETLRVNTFTAALVERATKEAALPYPRIHVPSAAFDYARTVPWN
jgi:hypothetical protein